LFYGSIFIFLTCFLTGCLQLAHVEIYNNTEFDMMLDSHGEKKKLNSGQSTRFILGRFFQIESALGTWHYQRNVPHAGDDGPYFNGTLRVQINHRGAIYALKTEELSPISDFSGQPAGYPMMPH
jgi:hypothetical protein